MKDKTAEQIINDLKTNIDLLNEKLNNAINEKNSEIKSLEKSNKILASKIPNQLGKRLCAEIFDLKYSETPTENIFNSVKALQCAHESQRNMINKIATEKRELENNLNDQINRQETKISTLTAFKNETIDFKMKLSDILEHDIYGYKDEIIIKQIQDLKDRYNKLFQEKSNGELIQGITFSSDLIETLDIDTTKTITPEMIVEKIENLKHKVTCLKEENKTVFKLLDKMNKKDEHIKEQDIKIASLQDYKKNYVYLKDRLKNELVNIPKSIDNASLIEEIKKRENERLTRSGYMDAYNEEKEKFQKFKNKIAEALNESSYTWSEEAIAKKIKYIVSNNKTLNEFCLRIYDTLEFDGLKNVNTTITQRAERAKHIIDWVIKTVNNTDLKASEQITRIRSGINSHKPRKE